MSNSHSPPPPLLNDCKFVCSFLDSTAWRGFSGLKNSDTGRKGNSDHFQASKISFQLILSEPESQLFFATDCHKNGLMLVKRVIFLIF